MSSLSDHPSEKTRFRLRQSIQENTDHGINALLKRARVEAAEERTRRAEEKAKKTAVEKLGCQLTEKDIRIRPRWIDVVGAKLIRRAPR
jgi:hypothetical protein